MSVINKPKVTSYSNGKNYVQITFHPDYEKFGLKELTKIIINCSTEEH